MPAKVFLDTNILVYAHDGGDRDKQKKSQSLIFECLRTHSGVISAQVLSEYFVTVTQKIKEKISLERAKKRFCFYQQWKRLILIQLWLFVHWVLKRGGS